jgi:hypothetical protein
VWFGDFMVQIQIKLTKDSNRVLEIYKVLRNLKTKEEAANKIIEYYGKLLSKELKQKGVM